MSYILDALRRAEAERERGSVPGVHTEQFPLMAGDDEAPRRPVWLIATVVMLALALAAVLAWNLVGSDPPKPPVAMTPVSPATPPALPMPLPATQPAATTSPAVVAAAPLATPGTSPVPATGATPGTLPRPPLPRPATAPATMPATAPMPPTTTAAAAEPRRPARPAAPPAAVPPPADDRIYSEAELPDAVRRTLPKLAFGGSSWSNEASSRMVIWNGRVFHEGDSVASGVVLKRINRKSAVLSAKGYRYEVSW